MSRLINADELLSHEFKNDISFNAFRNLVQRQQTVPAIPLELVKQMRDAQKRYFKTRDLNALAESKQLEKQVDETIANNGTEQMSLF